MNLININAYAGRWCCSHHWWQSYCASDGRWVCNDGTYSPSCTCWSTTTTTYRTYCPKNSTENSLGSCECNNWYIPNSSNNGCIKDPNMTCKIDYPGTYYSSEYRSCICPWKNIWRWSSKDNNCPTEYKSCYESFWSNSIDIGDNKCWCKEWYVMENNYCQEDLQYKKKNEIKKNIDNYNTMVKKYENLREGMKNGKDENVSEIIKIYSEIENLKTEIDKGKMDLEKSNTETGTSKSNYWWIMLPLVAIITGFLYKKK